MENQTLSTSSFKLFFIKFLIPSVLLIGIFAVALDYLFETKIIFKTYTSGAYKIYRNRNINSLLEIPVFGSSRAAGSYIPDLLDTNCFNYGIEKTGHALLELFLKNELSKNKTTPIIINFDYGLWNDGMDDHYNEGIGDLSNYIPNLKDDEIKNIFNKYDSWYYYVKGIRYYGYYQYYYKNYYSNKSKKNYLNKGGFFLREKTSQANLDEGIRARKLNPVKLSFTCGRENNFVNLLSHNKGRKIFIVIAPYHWSFMRTLKGKNWTDLFLERIKKIPNIYVLDYGAVSYPDSLFKNTTHVNYLGAKEFSNTLKEKLQEYAPGYFNN